MYAIKTNQSETQRENGQYWEGCLDHQPTEPAALRSAKRFKDKYPAATISIALNDIELDYCDNCGLKFFEIPSIN